jgi:hypothetical protein
MRFGIRSLFVLTTIAGIVLALVVLPMVNYSHELTKLQELAAAKGGWVRVTNGRAVAVEFNGPRLTDDDVARIKWNRFTFKMVLLYQCPELTDKSIDAMQLNNMPSLLYVDTTGSRVTWPRLVELHDKRQCVVSNGEGALSHPRVTTAMLNSF